MSKNNDIALEDNNARTSTSYATVNQKVPLMLSLLT